MSACIIKYGSADISSDDGLNYVAILETAIDVARGMLHLHSHNVIHADLKVWMKELYHRTGA